MKKIIFLTLLIPQIISAQMKQKECYTVYVNYPDYTAKTDIFSKDKKIKVNEKLTYYWYSSNKIMETTGGYDGRILNGPFTSFYLNSNLKEKGLFKNGVKNGEWITWYENGKIKEINTWRKGVRSGASKNFDVNGALLSEGAYKNGKLNGYQATYTSGKIREKRKYKNGIEITKKQKNSPKEQVISENPRSKISVKYELVKVKLKSVFKKKDTKEKKQTGENNKKNTPTVKPEKKIKEKIQLLFKKKDTSKKIQKTQNKAK